MIRLLILFCGIFCVLGKPTGEKCKITDTACLLNIGNEMYSSFFSSNSHLDPMHVDLIEGILPTLKYTITDSTAQGYKDCKIEYMNIDLDKLMFDITFLCPHIYMGGKYVSSGHYRGVPTDGSGSFTSNSSLYRFKTHNEIELERKDDRTHMHLKKGLNVELDPLQRITTNIENLFAGDEEKAAKFNEMITEHWKEFTQDIQTPMFNAFLKNILQVVNEYFEKNSIEDFIVL